MPFIANPLDPFTRSHSHSGEFPEATLKRVPASLREAIDRGPESFFAPLQEHFPETFAALTAHQLLLLLELEVSSPTNAGGTRTDSVFFFGIDKGEKLILAGIPFVDPTNEKNRRRQQKYYGAIPPQMAGFFGTFNGMNITTGIGFSGFDLPRGFSGWTRLDMHCQSAGLPRTVAQRLTRDGGFVDPRVLCVFRSDDFLVVDLGDASEEISLVRASQPDTATVLQGVSPLDRYFARAVDDVDAEIRLTI